MRKLIIDTDGGSDDAVAIIAALGDSDVEVLGLTTVSGNVHVDMATKNVLMTVEVCGKDVPVYKGSDAPLCRELVTAENVHGDDGMGDLDLIHPHRKHEEKDAVDFILDAADRYPEEVEIVMLGPATNVAKAVLRDKETMRKIKHIYSMGTSGFGKGNTTPVAEFNTYVDAEAYGILIDSKIPLTIIGFDVCIEDHDAVWNSSDLAKIKGMGKAGEFAVLCNDKLKDYNIRRNKEAFVDLPDAVAMAVALWPEVIEEQKTVSLYCHTKNDPCYGQVVVYDKEDELAIEPEYPDNETIMIKKIRSLLYKRKLEACFTEK